MTNHPNRKLLRYSVFVNGALAAKLDSFDVACALARAWSSDTASRGLADVVSKTGIVAQFGRGRATAEFAHVTVEAACQLWLGGHTQQILIESSVGVPLPCRPPQTAPRKGFVVHRF